MTLLAAGLNPWFVHWTYFWLAFMAIAVVFVLVINEPNYRKDRDRLRRKHKPKDEDEVPPTSVDTEDE